MVTAAQTLPRAATMGPLAWFKEFLNEELAPYPGRAGTVARMVLAATIVMIISMTFRIPYCFQGAIYALLISRESRRATLQASASILLLTGIGAAYLLMSVWFVISVPFLHFFWVIGSFFVVFFVLSTIDNYGATSIFAIMISIGVPLWDRHVSAETNVEDTLWLTLGALIGVAVTAAVELVFVRSRPGDDIVVPIVERLAAVHDLLTCYIEERPVDRATNDKLANLTMRGTSLFRRVLRRSDYSPQYRAEMGGVFSLIGMLVDLAAVLPQLTFEPSDKDRKQLRDLDAAVTSIRTQLMNRKVPDSISFGSDDEPSEGLPLLGEMARIIALIPQAFSGSRPMDEYRPLSGDATRVKLFASDAFTNPEHLQFAMKGCFAASLCYIIYNAVAWPGISTAVTTCLLTALSTIGSSRQKQILRFAGAFVGGFVIGMGCQMFVLTHLDSIAGFTVLFMLVTALASWVMTSSPRLSYFGLQMAVAFYLINLQEFAVQTSLSVARDRVVGILFGLLVMWLVFDQLWSAPAVIEMKRTFISNVRWLAQLVKEPLPGRDKTWRSDSLRETINANFDKVASLADAVLFELGPSRRQHLALRDRIRRWQVQLRMLLVLRAALLKYRLQLPGFELPEAVRAAQIDFDDQSAKMLEGMANRLEGKAPDGTGTCEDSFEQLEQTIRSCCAQGPQNAFPPGIRTFLSLSGSFESVAMSLCKDF